MFIRQKDFFCILFVLLTIFLSSLLWASPGHGVKAGSAGHKMEGSKGKAYKHGGSHHGEKEGSSYSRHGKNGHLSRKGHGHHGLGPFGHVLQFKKELGLTEQQVAFVKDKKFEYEKRKIEINAKHQVSHMELDRALHSENIDEKKINQIVDQMIAQKAESLKARIAAKLAVLNSLTPEQKKLVGQMYNQHN
tara:strand:+ start:191 stop:763 length:573 start_codon:yes stop_codon:yes gene_type:complete